MTLTISKKRVNYLEIVELALDRQKWGHEYTIYQYGNAVVTISMHAFYFASQNAQFIINAREKEKKNINYICWYMKNEDLDSFVKRLKADVVSICKDAVRIYFENQYDSNPDTMPNICPWEPYKVPLEYREVIDYDEKIEKAEGDERLIKLINELLVEEYRKVRELDQDAYVKENTEKANFDLIELSKNITSELEKSE